MRRTLLAMLLLLTMLLMACSNDENKDTDASQLNKEAQGGDGQADEATTNSQNDEHNDTTTSTDTPAAGLLIEKATELAQGQTAVSGIVSFSETDEEGNTNRFDTFYQMSDIDERFEDDQYHTDNYKSYIQQTTQDGEQFETYFSYGKSLYTLRDGEWFGSVMDETMDIGFQYRLNYFTPYIWLNYFGPFLESVQPYEVYMTDYIVEADINEPELQQFFESNMYMLAEENSIYHFNEWTFVDEPIHIYFIFNKEMNRLTEVGAVLKMKNKEYGVYEFNYVQQFDDFEVPSIKLPADVTQATGVSAW